MTTVQTLIRQIGDPILHAVPPRADFAADAPIGEYSSQLDEQIRASGGVGIACNQCAAIGVPLAMFVAGTDDETTRAAAQRRYPGETIPGATLMINPEIVSYGAETYYPPYGEGCLSVWGPLRGKVKRHRSVRVRYRDRAGVVFERECQGFEAHIVQHEFDHIQGTVFVQKILAECSPDQLATIAAALRAEVQRRSEGGEAPASVEPVLVFDRDGDAVVFDAERLALALAQTPDATLDGMLSIVAAR